jgi:hypothetical protein
MVSEAVARDRIDRRSMRLLTDQDLAVLARVEQSLSDGLALKRWCEQREATADYAERFELVRTSNPSDTSYGFFDQVTLDDRTLPVMGVVEDLLYDQPKQGPGERLRDEFREFVLHYFLRVSDYRLPEVYAGGARHASPHERSSLSWCPRPEARRIGFGYSQHYYKLRDSGLVGKFPEGLKYTIVDLREIGEKYEWIVVKVRIFDFNLTLRLPGQAQLLVPLNEETYLVLSRELISDEDAPAQSVLGRYGFGYAFIKNPTAGALAYGPGQFDAAVKLIDFRMLASGETRVRMMFVVNRPGQILNLSVAPVDWSFRLANALSLGLASGLFSPVRDALEALPLRLDGFDPLSTYISLANLLTGGRAAEELCISREQLERGFLVQHFMQHYQMIVGSLLTWRQIPDWLDKAALPRWVVTGEGG